MVLKTQKILVIQSHNEVPQEIWEEICDEMPNDSYRKVYLKPDKYEDKAREWLAQNGVKWNGKDDYEYVLFEICW